MKRCFIISIAGIILLALSACQGDPDQNNPHDPNNDPDRPMVLEISPQNGQQAVPVNEIITATLNEDIDTLSITSDNIVLMDGSYNIIAGVLSYIDRKISFSPVKKLNNCQTYTVLLTNQIRDIAGNTLETDYLWTFTTRISFEPQMIQVTGTPTGEPFTMGSSSIAPDTCPGHPVNISTFFIGKTEVTFDQFDEYCVSVGREKPHSNFGRGFMPVVNVNWYDAVDYCNWLSDMFGYTRCYYREGPVVKWVEDEGGTCDGFRLPTEAEWEYAAREAGKTDAEYFSGFWPGVTDVDDYAWHSGNAGGVTHEVATRNPNQLGLFDMSGNAAEWCWDWYASSYDAGEVTNPHGPLIAVNDNYRKVIRGGSWESWQSWWETEDTSVYEIATGVRYNKRPADMRSALGFRVCRNYIPEP